jgi:hypothetical protein
MKRDLRTVAYCILALSITYAVGIIITGVTSDKIGYLTCLSAMSMILWYVSKKAE